MSLSACAGGLLLLASLVCGCATSRFETAAGAGRRFQIQQDGFAFANELMWDYHFDPSTDKVIHHRPEYDRLTRIIALWWRGRPGSFSSTRALTRTCRWRNQRLTGG